MLSWDPRPGAVAYEVTRARFEPASRSTNAIVGAPAAPPFIPGPTRRIGSSSQPYFRDPTGADDTRFLYHVRAVDEAGRLSAPSNIAVVSGASEPTATFGALLEAVGAVAEGGRTAAAAAPLNEFAARGRAAAAAGDLNAARRELELFQVHLTRVRGDTLDSRDADDLATRASNLLRRVYLVQERALPRHALDTP